MRYTAKLTQNRRDVETVYPRRLLLDVRDKDGNLIRDHMWITEHESVANELYNLKIDRRKNQVLISFDAKEKQYQNHRTGDINTVLVKVRNIKRLK
jgi:hypothetical protein